VKKKIARMAANCFAMESATYHCASQIDSGADDYMLETAMLKVFTTEALWEIVNDAFQIHGGSAYFTDLPLERILRDARINQIAEGANEVLKSFIALVGMRGPGQQLQELQDSLRHPWGEWRKVWLLGLDRVGTAVRAPAINVSNPQLIPHAQRLGSLIRRFNLDVGRALIRFREEILECQLVQERLANVAMELFASACVLSRWDSDAKKDSAVPVANGATPSIADLFLRSSFRRARQALAELHDNDDAPLTATADWVMKLPL